MLDLSVPLPEAKEPFGVKASAIAMLFYGKALGCWSKSQPPAAK